jgi:UDP-N-acetylglucosamine--N-acetylmuramyl-(pentapeptide) pyrophosphoryl-undecaprenol N-acetylglucosamine transferase
MSKSVTPEYVFAGGGTGGHLFPGLAVANAIRESSPTARITFLTTERGLDRELLSAHDYQQILQTVRPWRSDPRQWAAFAWHWWHSVAHARHRFRNFPPRAVLGLGGYAAGPAVAAAARLGIPCAILNPDAIPGRANRVLARRADVVFQQWEVSRQHLAKARQIETVGCPIRSDFSRASRERGLNTFNLDPGRKTLLVTGASQGARTINDALARLWPGFVREHPDWQLLHLTGTDERDRIQQLYRQGGTDAVVVGFTNEMADAIAAADIVIARSGASTLAELCVIGKPAILLPYPYHKDQHQRANAMVLVQAGAAQLIDDARNATINAAAIEKALQRWLDPPQLQQAGEAARKLGQPSAAGRVAEWMLSR